jgi:predicted transcriptional regulator
MKKTRIQSLASLEAEMRAVARGERKAPADAARPSFNSVEALIRLLTPENRRLLAIIRDKKPSSIADLAKLTGRAASNLTRTLGKLEAAGLVRMEGLDKRKMPVATVKKLHVEIDPFSQQDRLEIA